jgi:hypothetical protein
MKEFLYIFGYEDPLDQKVNNGFGTDFETSRMIRISADSEAEAKQWGDEIAEEFVKFLFGREAMKGASWKTDRYSAWIENNPDEKTLYYWEVTPTVKVGEYPNFEELQTIVD